MLAQLRQSEAVNLLPTKADFLDAKRAPHTDLIAGFTVALVALPLALAFGVASGLGAAAGITTAIIAGAVAAVFGGSRLQVSGPTGAMTVVLVPIFIQHGSAGVLLVGFMAGLVLILLAASGIGSHISRLPTALIEGFTAGIAIVISLQQLPNLFGVATNDQEKVLGFAWQALVDATANFTKAPDLTAPTLAISVAFTVWLGNRIWPKLPLALAVLGLASIAAALMHLNVATVGQLPASIGQFDLGFFENVAIAPLVLPAIAVAALAALESLLSARVADQMRGTGERHSPNKELFGQGLANVIAPLFGGVAATAALARTAVNVKANAQSKLAALSHSVFLACAVLLFAGLVSQIPLAALAGVLLATTAHMIKPSELRRTSRASKLNALILWSTLIATVALDLISAVVLGLAIFLALRKTKYARMRPGAEDELDEESLGD